jgi:hypothetical protein
MIKNNKNLQNLGVPSSTLITQHNSRTLTTSTVDTSTVSPLDSWYITGFSDGESSFIVSMTKDNEYKTGWRVGLAFAIGLDKKDTILLERIKSNFKVGTIRFSKTNNSAIYSVQSVKDISNVIIPHFDKYPLLTQKRADFELFKSIVDLINRKVHRTPEGLQQLINIRASMNEGLSDKLKEVFPDTKPIPRPVIKSTEIPDPNWLSGFVDGEGCFHVSLKKSGQIQLEFLLSQRDRDLYLLSYLIGYLNSGYIKRDTRNSVIYFSITKFPDIIEKLIPLFDAYPLQGSKLLDYICFRKVAMLMKDKAHLTKEGADKIRDIKKNMNKERVH